MFIKLWWTEEMLRTGGGKTKVKEVKQVMWDSQARIGGGRRQVKSLKSFRERMGNQDLEIK